MLTIGFPCREYTTFERIIRISLTFNYIWKKLATGGIIFPIAMSGCIEILQATCTTNRSGDWLDFLANSLGVGLACLFSYYIIRPLAKKHLQ